MQAIEVEVVKIENSRVSLRFDPVEVTLEKIVKQLNEAGFEIINTREQKIIEQIKQAVIDIVHHMNNVDSIAQKSEYIVEKIGLSYPQISKIFSRNEPLTLERYIILNKIERIKQLILSDEFTLSEIAYMMDYSSVHYLSNQFKKETGMSVTDFKNHENPPQKRIEDLWGVSGK